MIGILSKHEHARIGRILEWVATPAELKEAMSTDFLELERDGALAFVHRKTFTFVEAVHDGHVLVGSAAFVASEDARTYLADYLQRFQRVDEIVDFLSQVQQSPPIVLEVFRNGRRLLLPTLIAVIEVRG